VPCVFSEEAVVEPTQIQTRIFLINCCSMDDIRASEYATVQLIYLQKALSQWPRSPMLYVSLSPLKLGKLLQTRNRNAFFSPNKMNAITIDLSINSYTLTKNTIAYLITCDVANLKPKARNLFTTTTLAKTLGRWQRL